RISRVRFRIHERCRVGPGSVDSEPRDASPRAASRRVDGPDISRLVAGLDRGTRRSLIAVNMVELADVTLVAVDTAHQALPLRALRRSRRELRSARVVLLTDDVPAGVSVPSGIDVAPIARLPTRAAYSEFVLKRLLPHVATTHVLLIQWDGYVANPAAWDPAFLACDYIGARWFWQPEGFRVGNGGFSLRSRKLLSALQDERIVLEDVEDLTIGRTYRTLLETAHGICFASEPLADRF